MDDLATLVSSIRAYLPNASCDLVARAYTYAAEAHAGQLRKSGNPYHSHAVATAKILADWAMPEVVIAAGLLHDVPEDTKRTIEDLRAAFGPEVATIVRGETKLSTLKYRGRERFAENLRRMFVAIAQDLRVVIVKFADRLDNLRTLHVFPTEKQQRIARETLEIYAPIANRFSMGEIKGQLEDLAFPFVYPEEAAWVTSLVAENEETKRATCASFQNTIEAELRAHRIPLIAIDGRTKRRYSLYQKLLRHERDITKIYDLIALRIIVKDIASCYAALGMIHQRWKPLKGRIKDYIASPKPNGYRSLHTTVFCEHGEIMELQIRTKEMHEEAEWGAAASWRYHERTDRKLTARQMRWIDELVQWQRNMQDSKQFLEELTLEALRDRIFVFTPKGDVIELPSGATPVDFAYAIHTDVGNHAIAARVNAGSSLYPLDRPIDNGDMVDILIDPKRKGPSSGWLETVRTKHARQKIRESLRSGLQAKMAGWMAAAIPKTRK